MEEAVMVSKLGMVNSVASKYAIQQDQALFNYSKLLVILPWGQSLRFKVRVKWLMALSLDGWDVGEAEQGTVLCTW